MHKMELALMWTVLTAAAGITSGIYRVSGCMQTIRNGTCNPAISINLADQRESKTSRRWAEREPKPSNFESIYSSLSARLKTEKCKNQFAKFVEDLQNSVSWAVEMHESTVKLPSGLISGNTYHLGNFDQCIGASSPRKAIRGKYCLANIEFLVPRKRYNNPSNKAAFENGHFSTVFEKIKASMNPRKKRIDSFYLGICIPDACRAEDAKVLLKNEMRKLEDFGYEMSVKVSDSFCVGKEKSALPIQGKILGAFIMTVIFFVLFCSFWDVTRAENNNKGMFHECVRIFSLSKNYAKFSRGSHKGNEEINILHGMKSLTMILTILGHRCMISCCTILNPQFLEERYEKIQSIFMLNGTLIVDTFFLIGGYLTFLILFKEYRRNKKLNLFRVFIYRSLRVLPIYMLVIFFYAYVLEHTGTGPMWKVKIGREAERCRNNWWTNLLFVNNYVNTDSMCMFQSWYIACDMHFTLLAPSLVILVAKFPRKAYLILASSIIGSLLSIFIVTYRYKYDGVLHVYISTLEDLVKNFTFNRVYTKTHHRAVPYFAGMASAYIYLQLKHSHHKFSMKATWMYSILIAFAGLFAIAGAWIFYIPGRKYNAFENAVYAACHRLMWAASMSWIIIGGGTKSFGILEPFLSAPIFKPFSKLSYNIFLIHPLIQLYTSSTLRVPEYMSFCKLYWMTCGDVLLSFLLAFIIHLFFEAPIKEIQVLFYKKVKSN